MLLGFGISAVNPIFGATGEPFIAPTISSWQVVVSDFAGYAQVDWTGATIPPACGVLWTIQNGTKKIYPATAWSSPDQTSPHAGTVQISDPTHRGLWYDLYWRWRVGAVYAPDKILLASAAVYIPTFGEGGGVYNS